MCASKNMLVDHHKRRITYLRVSVTDRCNLRCTYCMPDEKMDVVRRERVFEFEEILRLVSILAKRGLEKVRITGGEPLVRKGLVDFIADLHKIEGLKDIALTSNAVYLKEYARPLADAGLRRLNLSLDTLKRERFEKITRRDYYSRVWDGINEAEKVGFSPIKINVVLQKGFNDDEIDDFVRMTYDKPYHIRFIEFMPVAQWGNEWKKKFMAMEDIKEIVEKSFGEMIPLDKTPDLGPAANFRVKGAKGVVGFITAVSKHFCDTCNRIRLTSDGKMKPCLFSQKHINFLEAMKNGYSDEHINGLLDQVLATKPMGHSISLDKKTDNYIDSMVGIGG